MLNYDFQYFASETRCGKYIDPDLQILECQKGKIKKGDPEQRPQQEYCKQC